MLSIDEDPVFLGESRVTKIIADDGRVYELRYKMTAIEEGEASSSRVVSIDEDPVFLGESRVTEIIADDGRVYELRYKMTAK